MMIHMSRPSQKEDCQFSLTIIQEWLWHFIKDVEYHDQELDSYQKLMGLLFPGLGLHRGLCQLQTGQRG